MGVKKIVTYIFVIISVVCLSLWGLTEKWIADGKQPAAQGLYEYVVVLGAKVNGETPSLSLKYRLDAALEYAERYPHVKLILSGGQGPDEALPEAVAMKHYLIAHGIQENRLLLEEKSVSTYENISFSKQLLPKSVDGVTIITSDYHLARAKIIAGRLDLSTDAIPAKTPSVVRLKLVTRERLALLKTFLFQK